MIGHEYILFISFFRSCLNEKDGINKKWVVFYYMFFRKPSITITSLD